jgi:uncharacterized FlgJ-related protein
MKKLLCFILLFISLETDSLNIAYYPTYLDEVVIVAENFEETILNTLKEYSVSDDLAQIILAQAKFESGNFTSDIFWENNNPYGMKCPKKRKTLCIGTNRNHGVFNSVKEATIDYVYYMEALNIPFDEKNVKKYVYLLKQKRYFEAEVNHYYKGVKYYI